MVFSSRFEVTSSLKIQPHLEGVAYWPPYLSCEINTGMVICVYTISAYGPADATASLSSLAPIKSRIYFLVLAYRGCPEKRM